MNKTPCWFSALHPLGVCMPLVVLWGALACRGRLTVSDEPVALADAGQRTHLPPEVDAGVAQGPVELSDSGGPSGCGDGSRNGGESDIDCGGYCLPCATGFSCTRHEDCQSHVCRAGVCAPSCDDGVRNGNEVGVDCGGDCPRCRSATCNCANSAALSALSCDETPGLRSEARKIFVSDDGQTALYGACWAPPPGSLLSDCRMFRWTRTAGLELFARDSVPLGLSADGRQMLYQFAGQLVLEDTASIDAVSLPTRSVLLSRDGTQVVGVDHVAGGDALVRWTRASGALQLVALPGAPDNGEVTGLTPDGSVIVGHTYDPQRFTFVPFRWTAAGGLQDLGPLPGSATGAVPRAVSADGSVIVGLTTASSPLDLFRWTSTGMETLGPARPSAPFQLLVSTDGSVVAGTPGLDDSTGVRWSFPGGANVLFSQGGGVADMNADGSIVVGQDHEGSPLFWDVVNGLRRLQDIVASKGIDTSGWHLDAPLYVAEDGSYVFGTGLCGETPVTYQLVLRE